MTGSKNALEQKFLEFPLVVGKKWTFQYRTTTAGGKSYRFNAEVRVVDIEEINIPAGTFMAFKIERDDTASATWQRKWIYYYSPQARSIVKFFFDANSTTPQGKAVVEVELVKFGLAK